jgi:UDP-N-acetylmuramoyl-L-alanyl-D-glutamate--2,6-diaminopimelate ligase
VACKTALGNGRFGADAAFARGCRAFLCCNDVYPGEEAAVWIADEPECLLGELAARLYGYPARQMTVLGITGSTGKTSVAQLTVGILRCAGKRVSSLTSDGADLLGKRVQPDATVPDAAYIQRLLAQMVSAGSEIAVLELSSYQLKHFAAVGIPFTGVLLTNLSHRHVGGGEHESFEDYCDAKLSLMHAPSAFCVLPAQMDVQTRARILRVGEMGEIRSESVRIEQPFAQAPTVRFCLCIGEERCDVTLPCGGMLAVENVLCAAALCRIVGLDIRQIAQGLLHTSVHGRMECLSARHGRLIYLDAAFLPQDLERVLNALRPLATGRLSVLLGSVGGRARSRRVPLVKTAEALADHLYLTADDPDFEDPLQICTEMRDAMSEPLRATVIVDRRAAILRAVREMRQGDLLLILAKPCGRGQLVGGGFLPFDERETVKEGLSEF